jgi:hypothetical protein
MDERLMFEKWEHYATYFDFLPANPLHGPSEFRYLDRLGVL